MHIVTLTRRLPPAMLVVLAIVGCRAQAGLAQGTTPPTVVLTASHTNPVAAWHDIGVATISATADRAVTDSERRPAFAADMATMHLAMYDAVMAIDKRYRPFLYAPPHPDTGASVDAAIAAAAYGVLKELFPNRSAQYRQAYERAVAALPDEPGKARGIAAGTAAAAAHLQRRASDGRAAVQAPYVSSEMPGRFRGSDPVNRNWPAIRPFVLRTVTQFRPPPPPALTSVQYAADFNEVKALGGTASAQRTAAQLETARFHSEPPMPYFTRNFGRFARSTADTVDAARLMAAIYTNYSDAIAACLEAKYHYDAWRPKSAIALADTDDNPATAADPDWTPLLPTPNHPEYPGAHSCSAATLGELLRHIHGTQEVTFTWDSKVTNTSRTYTSTHALADESRDARIHGGMHFRFANTAGAELGKRVAEWTMQHAFMRQPE